MTRVYNFNPGPAMLPTEVLQQIQAELLDYQGSGMSIMEVSHRSKEFDAVVAQSEADLRELLSIPTNYKILFLQGGATSQFAMIPMNLLRGKKSADYICTGMFSKKALEEAKRFCEVNVAASSEANKFTNIPEFNSWKLSENAAYVSYVENETIQGVEFNFIPAVGDKPLVCDMSSNFLSREFDINKFGLVYGGAQKNLGIAGITFVIVREDLVGQTIANTPSMFDYQIQIKDGSRYNTPATFAWYVTGLVLQWIKKQGGVKALETINQRKADKLYQTIEQSSFYKSPVEKSCRSRMNVPFTLPNTELESVFLKEAAAVGLVNLAGHRSVGGMRASIYNSMPESGVNKLCDFMQDFAQRKA